MRESRRALPLGICTPKLVKGGSTRANKPLTRMPIRGRLLGGRGKRKRYRGRRRRKCQMHSFVLKREGKKSHASLKMASSFRSRGWGNESIVHPPPSYFFVLVEISRPCLRTTARDEKRGKRAKAMLKSRKRFFLLLRLYFLSSSSFPPPTPLLLLQLSLNLLGDNGEEPLRRNLPYMFAFCLLPVFLMLGNTLRSARVVSMCGNTNAALLLLLRRRETPTPGLRRRGLQTRKEWRRRTCQLQTETRGIEEGEME